MPSTDQFVCVVYNPPADLLERAEKHGVDVAVVIGKITKPRAILAKLPVQLLDGCEYSPHTGDVAQFLLDNQVSIL